MSKLIRESIDAIVYHYKQGSLNWPMVVFLTLAHVAAVIGLFTIRQCHPYTLFWSFLLWVISGVGITGGVHRLWAHRSYKASLPMRIVLMLANSIANQGSIWHWSRDHRCHHKHSEVSHLSLVFLLIHSYLYYNNRLTLILITRLVASSSLTWDGS